MSWFVGALKKYAVFSGRARRKEYWMFVLFYVIFAVVIAAVEGATGVAAKTGGLLSAAYSLALLLPSLAVSVRRLHDTGRSGWAILIGLIPLVGAIILLVWTVQDSNAGDNKYGPNPKAAPAA